MALIKTAPVADYRPDIDGLRALAVTLVVGFHAFPLWVRGGYIGVDIFFVISGYLITRLLLKDLARSGRLDIKLFYIRRIRRIFPALLAVFAVLLVFAWYWFAPEEFTLLGRHLLGAATFTSNFVLLSESGYFDHSAETKLLLHLWSLAVEEQFYLVFPWLLMLAVARSQLLGWIFGAFLLSLVANVNWVSGHAEWVFYLPVTRFWELLAGSLLVVLEQRRGRPLCQGLAAELLMLGGIVLIAAACLLMDRNSLFPGWWALLPVAGASLLIAAGGQSWLGRRVMAAPPMIWIGLISYPLYLWHWPLLALAAQFDPAPSRTVRVGAVILALLLSVLTYRLLERPLRHGGSTRRVVGGLALAMVLLGSLGLLMNMGVWSPRSVSSGSEYVLSRDESRRIKAAVQGQSCPAALVPDERVRSLCRLHGDVSGSRLIVAWGDSHIESWLPVLDALARERSMQLVVFQHSGCPPLLAARRSDPASLTAPCGTLGLAERVLTAIERLAPQQTFWIARWGVYADGWRRSGKLEKATLFLTSSAAGEADQVSSRQALQHSFRPTAERLVSIAPLVLIESVPELKEPVSFFNSERLEQIEPARDVEMARTVFIRGLYDQLADMPEVRRYAPGKRLCQQHCRAILDRRVMYDDDNHLSGHGAMLFKPDLGKLID